LLADAVEEGDALPVLLVDDLTVLAGDAAVVRVLLFGGVGTLVIGVAGRGHDDRCKGQRSDG
jgi:hypothetical protein